MTERELDSYLRALLGSPGMQNLWQIKDRGMPVYAHAVDVALLCLEALPRWSKTHGRLDVSAILIGSLVHDVSKLIAHHSNGRSHSQLMSLRPDIAVDEARRLLKETERLTGIKLVDNTMGRVAHIVASHHGPWGRIRPRTPEATLVFRADYFSATHHRLSPIDANDILPLLNEGYRWAQVGVRLGVGRALVKLRLQEACRAESVEHWIDLLQIWQKRGMVVVGSGERLRKLERARSLITWARQAPESLLDGIAQFGDGEPDGFADSSLARHWL